MRKSGRHDGRVAEVRRVRYACKMHGSMEIFCDLGEAGYEELGLFFFYFILKGFLFFDFYFVCMLNKIYLKTLSIYVHFASINIRSIYSSIYTCKVHVNTLKAFQISCSI